ncbi:MAG: hypothetical protein AB1453_03520 [Chloroflexota bacterium]
METGFDQPALASRLKHFGWRCLLSGEAGFLNSARMQPSQATYSLSMALV